MAVLVLCASSLAVAGCCENAPEEKPRIPSAAGAAAGLPSAAPEPVVPTSEEAPTDQKDYVVDKLTTGRDRQLPGPTKTTVPDVRGMDLAAAEAKVKAAGLTFYSIPRPQAPWKDKVWQQNPPPGTTVNTGSEVMVTHAP